jgi:hypothetical protein
VQDYVNADEWDYESAARFLYAEDDLWRDHREWACSIANVDPAWLRDALQRNRRIWDEDRRRGNQLRRRAKARQSETVANIEEYRVPASSGISDSL